MKCKHLNVSLRQTQKKNPSPVKSQDTTANERKEGQAFGATRRRVNGSKRLKREMHEKQRNT